MAEYIVSARKYRPGHFNEMVGQEQVAVTLKNAIKNEQLAHSFLFCGPRGVGKTTAARILAKTINCENLTADFEACDQCPSCVSFIKNSSFNIHELDAASNNSVEDIREIVNTVRIPPQSARYKIYIIDEVHMLSSAAFNAFLKTLEEPPPYAKFILATTEKHKILPTILSRCQIFDFKRIPIDTIVKHLKQICSLEKIEAEDDALHVIAQKADGGMRDALSMFDRLSSFAGGKLTYESVLENLNVLDYDYFFKVTDALLTENLPVVLQLLDQVLKKGFEGDDFIIGLCEHFRNLLFCKDDTMLRLLEVSDTLKQKYSAQSALASADFLINCLNLGNQSDVQYKTSKNKRLTVELALIKMCYVNAVVTTGVDAGKKKVANAPKTEVSKLSLDEKPVTTTIPTPQVLEEPSPVVNKIPAQTPKPQSHGQPTQLSKGKKLLTVDSLKDKVEEINAKADAEEKYDGDISILNQENILKLWNDFANQISDEKKGLKMSFANFTPVWTESQLNKMTLTVQSLVQKSQFEDVKGAVQRFISQRVGVEMILEVIADKVISNTVKPYTPKEKLERLIQKNPVIKKMQQEFSLELDY